MKGQVRTMYDSYGRYIGYPVYIVTLGGHDFEFDSRIDADKFVEKIESRYAQRGISAEGKYSRDQRWHSGF